jgi:hypothetical protein
MLKKKLKSWGTQIQEYKIALFQGNHIRKVLHNNQWWFPIIDVIEVLIGGGRPRKYWNDLKKKAAWGGV